MESSHIQWTLCLTLYYVRSATGLISVFNPHCSRRMAFTLHGP